MASQVVMKISRDEEERARIMRDEKILLDYQCKMAYARKVGMKQGMQRGMKRGMQQGMQQIINLLKEGKSPEDILKDYSNI